MENPVSESRQGRGNWLIGLVLIVLGALFLVGQFINIGGQVLAIAFIGGGVTFLLVFLTARERWWALIPAYVLGLIGTFLLVEPVLRGNTVPIYWLSAIGLPFLIVFLTKPRERWWALIPAYVMAVVSVFLLFERWFNFREELTASYFVFAIAAPFLLVFLTRPRERWWALIPGGIMAAVGLGLSASVAQFVLPAALVLGGLVLLISQFARPKGDRTPPAPPAPPASGPEADRASE